MICSCVIPHLACFLACFYLLRQAAPTLNLVSCLLFADIVAWELLTSLSFRWRRRRLPYLPSASVTKHRCPKGEGSATLSNLPVLVGQAPPPPPLAIPVAQTPHAHRMGLDTYASQWISTSWYSLNRTYPSLILSLWKTSVHCATMRPKVQNLTISSKQHAPGDPDLSFQLRNGHSYNFNPQFWVAKYNVTPYMKPVYPLFSTGSSQMWGRW